MKVTKTSQFNVTEARLRSDTRLLKLVRMVDYSNLLGGSLGSTVAGNASGQYVAYL